MWFTDFGKVEERRRDRGGVYYAKADGSLIKEMVYPIDGPNGIGLAPGDKHLYVPQTFEGRVWQWDIPSPGELSRVENPGGAYPEWAWRRNTARRTSRLPIVRFNGCG
jgi:gluconolactonase